MACEVFSDSSDFRTEYFFFAQSYIQNRVLFKQEGITQMITDKGTAVPDDMAGVLQAEPEALTAFEALRPADQRVYVDWIGKSADKAQRAERLSGLGEHVRSYQRRPAEEHGSPHPLLDA